MRPDEEEAARARELKVARFIALAFVRVGLPPADDGVFYDQENDREAIVTLDDDEIDLNAFMRLQTSGLASSYKLAAASSQITVRFTVDAAIDTALGMTR